MAHGMNVAELAAFLVREIPRHLGEFADQKRRQFRHIHPVSHAFLVLFGGLG